MAKMNVGQTEGFIAAIVDYNKYIVRPEEKSIVTKRADELNKKVSIISEDSGIHKSKEAWTPLELEAAMKESTVLTSRAIRAIVQFLSIYKRQYPAVTFSFLK